MNKKISNKERFILLCAFVILIIVYSILSMNNLNINPIIKFTPFLAILVYIYIKPKLPNKNRE